MTVRGCWPTRWRASERSPSASSSLTGSGDWERTLEENKPSRTARTTAAHRAHESQKPASERVCDDPYAHLFLGRNRNPLGDFFLPTRLAFWLWERLMPGW